MSYSDLSESLYSNRREGKDSWAVSVLSKVNGGRPCRGWRSDFCGMEQEGEGGFFALAPEGLVVTGCQWGHFIWIEKSKRKQKGNKYLVLFREAVKRQARKVGPGYEDLWTLSVQLVLGIQEPWFVLGRFGRERLRVFTLTPMSTGWWGKGRAKAVI